MFEGRFETFSGLLCPEITIQKSKIDRLHTPFLSILSQVYQNLTIGLRFWLPSIMIMTITNQLLEKNEIYQSQSTDVTF